jgi:hypothetical protein
MLANIKKMKTVFIIVTISLLFACSSELDDKSEISNKKNFDNVEVQKFYKILEGIKKDYVFYYKELKSINFNFEGFGDYNDSLFQADTLLFARSYTDFFNQDRLFVEWLLQFRNDTTKAFLWIKYHYPLSSHLSKCNLPMTNSDAAIILIENYLNGQGLECIECENKSNECYETKYVQIVEFLESNKNLDGKELREKWKRRNVR